MVKYIYIFFHFLTWFQNRRFSEWAQIGPAQIEGYLYFLTAPYNSAVLSAEI
jgi:hypothetical protein